MLNDKKIDFLFKKINEQFVLLEQKGLLEGFLEKNGVQYWYDDENGKLHRDNDQPAIIHADGTKKWYQNGLCHRDNDQPAIMYASGTKEWYQNNKLHRDNDKPAIIRADGTKVWYQNGKLHRDNDQPAEIWKDGTQYWYQHDNVHRDNDQPAVIYDDGTKFWYQNGKLHRDNDQPAIIHADGRKEWYQNGKLHRDNDQPAIIHADGRKEWHQNGEERGEERGDNGSIKQLKKNIIDFLRRYKSVADKDNGAIDGKLKQFVVYLLKVLKNFGKIDWFGEFKKLKDYLLSSLKYFSKILDKTKKDNNQNNQEEEEEEEEEDNNQNNQEDEEEEGDNQNNQEDEEEEKLPFYDEKEKKFVFPNRAKIVEFDVDGFPFDYCKEFFINFDWRNSQLSWLLDSDFNAEVLRVNSKNQIVTYFKGEWKSGDFKGQVMLRGSIFNSGRFLGGHCGVYYDDWKVSPVNFYGKSCSSLNGGMLGVSDLTKYNKTPFHLMQVPNGYCIEFSFPTQKINQILRVDKRLDVKDDKFIFTHLNTGKQIVIPWEKIRQKFGDFQIEAGYASEVCSLFFEIKQPIYDISIYRDRPIVAKVGDSKIKEKAPIILPTRFFPRNLFELDPTSVVYLSSQDKLYDYYVITDDLLFNGAQKFTYCVENIAANNGGYDEFTELKDVLPAGKAKADKKCLEYLSHFFEIVVDNIGFGQDVSSFTRSKEQQDVFKQYFKEKFNFNQVKQDTKFEIKTLKFNSKTPIFGELGLTGDFKFYTDEPKVLQFYNDFIDDLSNRGLYLTEVFENIRNSKSGNNNINELKDILPDGILKTDYQYIEYLFKFMTYIVGNIGVFNTNNNVFVKNEGLQNIVRGYVKKYFNQPTNVPKQASNKIHTLRFTKKTPIFGELGLTGDFKFYSQNAKDLYFYNDFMDDMTNDGIKIKKCFSELKTNKVGNGGVDALKDVLPDGRISMQNSECVNYLYKILIHIIGNVGYYNTNQKMFLKNLEQQKTLKEYIKRYFVQVPVNKNKSNNRNATKMSFKK